MDIELTGNYPIMIDGRKTGELRVSRDGLFWDFRAESGMLDGLVRLSVYGEDGEGYLGVMAPEGDGLYLEKKLSRSALANFPKSIEHAGRSGGTEPPASVKEAVSEVAAEAAADTVPAVQTGGAAGETDVSDAGLPSIDAAGNDPREPTPQESEMPPPAAPSALYGRGRRWRPCALPCSLFSDIEAKCASGEIKGAMISSDGTYTLLAVPLSLAPKIGRDSILRFDKSTEIEGVTYVVCSIKDGKPRGAP